MLVLSRRVGERLLIGDDIVVTVIEVRSDGVRLGIEAPRDVRVHRAEVLDAVRAANAAAVEADSGTEAALKRLVPAGAGSAPAPTPPAATADETTTAAEPASGGEAAPAHPVPAAPAAPRPTPRPGPRRPQR